MSSVALVPENPVIDLQLALLAPRTIALVGVSDDETKTTARPLQFLRRAGFPGTIYPVNRKRAMVQGERTWPSVATLPTVPDHVFILTPAVQAIDAVEECARLGVPVATILASGFGESGKEGLQLEQRLRDVIARTGIRVLGPSSLGVVNVQEHVVLTANAAFAEPDMPVGRTFVASHSGSLIGALVSRGKARGIGFAGLVSVGNEVDLSIGEVCAATLDDPGIDGYLLFLESIRSADALRAFAHGAAARGKPVAAYKLGRSPAGAELALSHTGALAGDDDIADAFLRECGIARVETLDALIECMPLLRKLPLPERPIASPRVGIVTTTGGGGAMVVDQLGVRNIVVHGPSADTLDRLADAGVGVRPSTIIDLTLTGTRYDVMKTTLDVMSTAPEFDMIVAVAGSSARFQPDLAVRPIVDSAGNRKPLAAFIVPEAPTALARLTEAGIANFRTPEACADAIAAAFSRHRPRTIRAHPRPMPIAMRLLDEAAGYALLERVNVPHARYAIMDADAPRLPAELRYPVVVKLLSSSIAHKTDVGGVVLGVRNHDELNLAVARIRTEVGRRSTETIVDRVLVQEMVSGAGEVLVGYRRDAQAGPIVMLAAGGVLAEIYRDRTLRLAPIDLAVAHDMIGEVKALRALMGYRGAPHGDLDALAETIAAVSRLAELDDPVVVEAEMNPVIVGAAGAGVVAVDALVRIG